jgi:hypothetical protein
MHREDEGGRVVSLSSSPSMEDLELGGVHPHPFAARPTARRALSLSLSMSMFPRWRHASPPTLPHPRASWHLAAFHDCPQDSVQGHECNEKIESRKPSKQDQTDYP